MLQDDREGIGPLAHPTGFGGIAIGISFGRDRDQFQGPVQASGAPVQSEGKGVWIGSRKAEVEHSGLESEPVMDEEELLPSLRGVFTRNEHSRDY